MALGVDNGVFEQLVGMVGRGAHERLRPLRTQGRTQGKIRERIVAEMTQIDPFCLSAPQSSRALAARPESLNPGGRPTLKGLERERIGAGPRPTRQLVLAGCAFAQRVA